MSQYVNYHELPDSLLDMAREEFTDRFYQLWDDAGFGEPDYDSPNPWGCPWHWGFASEYNLEDPEQFFLDNKINILEEIANDLGLEI